MSVEGSVPGRLLDFRPLRRLFLFFLSRHEYPSIALTGEIVPQLHRPQRLAQR